ncbi:hypothetical protein CCUS01_09532 [Colletotrichum cuscutae]|uniref:Uncharacterized protein n=1 Tax=Colletotrichum cuscutae TaxID=1209917 RepID=A0AAI9XP11_9PEZI|nr:hypothetical protein CCUS01_09532 [Colletotrichum cuscutae]
MKDSMQDPFAVSSLSCRQPPAATLCNSSTIVSSRLLFDLCLGHDICIQTGFVYCMWPDISPLSDRKSNSTAAYSRSTQGPIRGPI